MTTKRVMFDEGFTSDVVPESIDRHVTDIPLTTISLNNTGLLTSLSGISFDHTLVSSTEVSYKIIRSITKESNHIIGGVSSVTIEFPYNHDLFTGDKVVISGSNTSPSIDGTHTITKVNNTSFSITVSTSTSSGSLANCLVSLKEYGSLTLDYADDWYVTRTSRGKAKVDLDFTSAGQCEYIATAMSGINYSGTIVLSSKMILE